MSRRLIETEWTSASPLVSQAEAMTYLGVDQRAFTKLLTSRRLVRHESGVFLRREVENLAKQIEIELTGEMPAQSPAPINLKLSLK